ncbi:MAG: sugar phosphate nucleotidyltransferase [Thermoanaerobacterales bacterium]|nr:sugar phosphate nucleotidyltransferase [Thermoanaerobacterales bacterium]
MKAIIMAGGEGSRLRPLTCGRPKPLVPVLNRPIMEYCVDLLRAHGITEIGVTLQYLPDAVREHFGDGSDFGVRLHYFIEESPLGTAGSVKNAGAFLDETFLVVSGDALTDLDLSRALSFHHEQRAVGTLVLTRVETPLEYGVVITGEDGRIIRFLEKPGWGEVFSDTVNTGIYVLEPEVLDFFAPGQKFDFSKDLFPLLLRENKPLYGLVLPGYWCDIGDLRQYWQAHQDALSGRVAIRIPGAEIAPRVWAGRDTHIDPDCLLEGPVLVGDHCRIGRDARIEAFTVLGRGCTIQPEASIKRSVLWDHVYVGRRSAIRGAVLGSRVQVQAGAGVYEGAVVGEDSVIKERGTILPAVKLWPHKLIETGATVRESLVWGTRQSKNVFGTEGIGGLVNVEMTPEFAARVAAVFGAAMGRGKTVAVSSDVYPASTMLRRAVAAGLQSAGAHVLDLGGATTPMHRFAVRSLACTGGVHVRLSAREPERAVLLFTDQHGANISRSLERKMENLLAREDFARVEPSAVREPALLQGMAEAYLQAMLSEVDLPALRARGGSVVCALDPANLERVLDSWTRETGMEITNIMPPGEGEKEAPQEWAALQELVPHVAATVVERRARAGVVMDAGGEHLILIDDRGRVIQDDLLTVLIVLYVLKTQGGPVVVPVTAPQTIETLAERYQATVVRTKTALRDFIERILAEDVSQFFLHFDALAALTRILSFAAGADTSLSRLVDEIPAFYTHRKDVPVSWEAKGRVIRRLIEDEGGKKARMEVLDGVKVFHPEGWSLVLPDPEQPVCRVFSEGASMEIAESLTEMYIDKIKKIINEN